MPILAVDQMGRIYQTSGDRADGLGFGHYPECEGQSDTTLGAAYLKSQRRQQQELLNRKRNQQILDTHEKQVIGYKRQMGQAKRHREKQASKSLQHPSVFKRALQMGCSCDYNGPFGGNVMTANGLRGLAGMSRDQQVIHTEVIGLGNAQAHPVNPVLSAHAEGRKVADRYLRLTATPGARTGKTSV